MIFLSNYTQNSKFLLKPVGGGTEIHKKFLKLDLEISPVIIEK